MRITFLFALFCLGAASAPAGVDFAHEVAPILREHCVECHGGGEAKGGFSLNTRELFLEDEAAVPGQPGKSLFLELIRESDPELRMPPEKKARVPQAALAVLERWVAAGLPWEPGFSFGGSSYEPPLEPRRPGLPPVSGGRENPVDRFIDAYLADRGRPRPDECDDATFLRRVHLDLVGLLPDPAEVRAFLADRDPDKRTKMVDALLARDLDYADHWLTFWNDLLRNDYTGTGFITGGRRQVSRWLYDALKENRPFDVMVRELVAPPTPESEGFIKGIEWRGEVSAGQSLPIQFAQSISQSFLGINLKCASCHDSFIDRWTLAEAYGLAAVYSETPLAIHRCDQPTGETASPAWLFPELGQIDADADRGTRLRQLAALITDPRNGRLTRTLVNRLWGQLMGRGLVHPLDAMQTEPWHPDLLDWLAGDFSDNGHDLRRTLRLIATSAAYQSHTEVAAAEEDGGAYTYAGPRAKRLTAEQFVDLMWSRSGTAPATFEAPVVRGLADPGDAARLARKSTWIWGPSASAGPVPGGEKVLLRRDFEVTRPVRSAGVVGTADNFFTLHLNGAPVFSGDDWSRLSSAPVSVKQGFNQVLVVAENGAAQPNPAGAFVALRIVFEDGGEEIVASDGQWLASPKVPAGEKVAHWKIADLPWVPAVEVSHGGWTRAVDPQVGKSLAACSVSAPLMVRASLVQADFLMRSLGRPNRDQIVTSRPRELTTLEAVDLSNEPGIAEAVAEAARRALAAHPSDPALLLEELYLSTLTRMPTDAERELLLGVLGNPPEADTVADLVWSLWMSPESLLVR